MIGEVKCVIWIIIMLVSHVLMASNRGEMVALGSR